MTARRTIVRCDPRSGAVPAAALALVRDADAVYATAELAETLGLPPVPASVDGDVVVFARSPDDLPGFAGAEVVELPAPPGHALLDAVAVMDRLRSPGGCPWDAEQTHESLRKYLREEAYELLDAIADDDRDAMREELGDVLLQVLFHARVAQESDDEAFSIDDVAGGLVTKLVGRHPHVFGDGDSAVRDASTQERRWEELKQVEKRRESSVDGVAMDQPSLALAAKLVQRTDRAKLPAELLPADDSLGARLFRLAATAQAEGRDAEDELRAVDRGFAADVRAAEAAARAAGLDPATMGDEGWRRFWPR
ncbi:MazG family protein [Labedaea rhizosphaerae]|uniref:XTP/dITP diphosphohydrolase n=1 Tax=Labedaea rhizosphaerae TaxID=598644 RepID=A0A4R6SJL9_LABRH|nr:MazG family protein [Labedaea rhizosphaerae]TDQ04268.1 XTP/dITP diphosphohydrolase [Labedaea rhizosphaerae]